ncbi:MAG: diguanylate cyclase [Alphaproteobacteria bacterium]|jgi:diguanylate cyclase (GGDEF)-like protein/PAS domain S-box-containing protein|nr:diguanylate cyclase [Alphaproteobacteria bacterium]
MRDRQPMWAKIDTTTGATSPNRVACSGGPANRADGPGTGAAAAPSRAPREPSAEAPGVPGGSGERTDPPPDEVFRHLIERLDDAVIVTKAAPVSAPGPEIVFVNAAATAITGYRADELVGRTPRMLQGPGTDPAALGRIRAALEAGRGCREQLLNYGKTGAPYWFDIRIVPIESAAGARYFAAVQRDVTRERAVLARLKRTAERDVVTGLANRNGFERHLARLLDGTRRADASNALVMVDVDAFKHVNDTYGHRVGDETLRGVAEGLKERCRDQDLVARFGGDEFAVLVRDVRAGELAGLVARLDGAVIHLDGAAPLAVRISAGVIHLDGAAPPAVRISAGGALFAPGDDAGAVIARADRALYRAKAAGRSRVAVVDGGDGR